MQSFTISGSDAGLQTNKKPFLLPDKAFPVLENAYVWRDRVVKRYGLELLGRLQRNLGPLAFGNFDGAGGFSGNIFVTYPQEATATIVPGSVRLITAANTFSDINPATLNPANGQLFGLGGGVRGFVNYITGEIQINVPFGPSAGQAATITFSYNPNLPVMGIWQREIPDINDEQTIFWDTNYAYIYDSVGERFQEFTVTLNTWSGTDSDFFWATNWRGSTPQSRLFFATNFVNNAANAMRYTSGGAWTAFAPIVSAPPESATTTYLTQARILIPYYGRLLALNVWESPDSAGNPAYASGVNIFNRCRYSQIGDPTAADAWRSDLFGKGGFIDAPTSEQIISAVFFKNTLIVFFERTTWQLRYVGEYGIPFIWERISSDFGSESTFSPVLFDQGVAAIGDRAIISSNAVTVDRIDLQIPDFVFDFRNSLAGPQRAVGARDFQKELVYWCFNDFDVDTENQKFPNKVLVYNYRNNTYAIFRDNITFFGTFQAANSVTWDSETVLWDDQGITWDSPSNQSQFPSIVSGNQQGFIHYYNKITPDQQSLYISGVNLTTTPIQLTIPNHNLYGEEIIYISGLSFLDGSFLPVTTNLNDKIYRVSYINDNTIGLFKWDSTNQQYINNFSFTPATTSTYVGGGVVTLFPKLDVQTKDFNPYLTKGAQAKLTYIDFLTDATPSAVMTVNLYANTQVGPPAVRSNVLVGNRESETYLVAPYYGNNNPTSDIAWHRFYCTLIGQFFRIQMTYDDDLMNQLSTHQQTWVLNAITLWTRPGGKLIF